MYYLLKCCSSLESLDIGKDFRIVIHMIFTFLMEIVQVLPIFLIVLFVLVLLITTIQFKSLIFLSSNCLFVLVVVGLGLLVQFLCHWVFHFQIVLETVSLWVLVECVVNVVVLAGQWRWLVCVFVQGCLCAELMSLLPWFVVVWGRVKVQSVACVRNIFSAWWKTFQLS